ncbi:MAG: orotidine-5'-phosphate decarboxylase [Thermomicrobiales bacterium]|nr:orotidine-5'-phosphate decarboxylase [Thermomicrobiales bacterium]
MATNDTVATWADRLRQRMGQSGSLVCVGLDPDVARLPEPLRAVDDVEAAIVRFNAGLIEATADLVCAYKPNLGFYLAHGAAGIRALERTRALVPPDVPVILDAKIGDIGSTAAAYARGVYDVWRFDAVTLNPYLGSDALEPFLNRPGRGVFILCKTSNPGSGEFQDLPVSGEVVRSLALDVAAGTREWSARFPATVGLVVGATYPADLAAVRALCPDQPILLPGIGAQVGDLAAAVAAGMDRQRGGLIVTSSRAIIYAGSGADWAARARAATVALRDAIETARSTATSHEGAGAAACHAAAPEA